MGRIIKLIKVITDTDEKELNALFDSGAGRSYIKKDRLPKGEKCKKIPKFISKVGGKTHEINSACMINAEIEGLPFNLIAYPVDDIGPAEGMELDMIIGAPAMEEWEITLNSKKNSLNIKGLETREFIEFFDFKIN